MGQQVDSVSGQGSLNSHVDVGMFVASWTLTALASNHCLKLLHFVAVSRL